MLADQTSANHKVTEDVSYCVSDSNQERQHSQREMQIQLTFESIGGVLVDVFQGLPLNSMPLCLTSWQKSKETSLDLW